MIVSGPKLSAIIQSIKNYSAKQIIKNLKDDSNLTILQKLKDNKLNHKIKSNYQVWQEGFHPQELISDNMFSQKVDYIHLNPVRRKHVEEPQDWKYSSAGYYYTGKESILRLNGLE